MTQYPDDIIAEMAREIANLHAIDHGFPEGVTIEEWSGMVARWRDKRGTSFLVERAMSEARACWSVVEKRMGPTLEIATERRRQVEVEGWTPSDDDKHDHGEMALAAAAYAIHSSRFRDADALGGKYALKAESPLWPWGPRYWKPKNPRRDLIRAAALIVAEIERLDRRSPPPSSADEPTSEDRSRQEKTTTKEATE